MYTAKAKLAGIIGKPISHSLSPLIQMTIAKELGIDFVYSAFHIEESLEEAIKGAYALGISGLNITIPFKQEVISHLLELSDEAKIIGAVNTLLRVNGGYKGYNTDVYGIKKALEKADINIKKKDIVLLGAGGAAKAVLYVCAKEGVESISLISRDINKAKVLSESVKAGFPDIKLNFIRLSELDAKSSISEYLPKNDYIAFQASPVGMHPNVDKAIIECKAFYDKCEAGMDLVYNPAKTKFIQYFIDDNKKVINGLDMLIYQGIRAFELWNGIEVGEEIVLKLRQLLMLDK